MFLGNGFGMHIFLRMIIKIISKVTGVKMSDTGIIMVQHGDFPFDFIKGSMKSMEHAEKHIEAWPEMVRPWQRDENNDPLY
jgi:hypothetical protein